LRQAQFQKASDGTYRCTPFEQFTWLDHGFSTRNSVALPGSITTLKQIHSDLVRNARGLQTRSAEGDSLICDEPGKVIGVRTADCVPILLVDANHRAVAAIHAGWRGTTANIVARTIEHMADDFQTNPSDIFAAIGPAIEPSCYQVGFEVAEQFLTILPELADNGKNRAMLDLWEANCRLLIAAGVPSIQVHSSELCTFCNPDDFFSYRRDRTEPGRMISFISNKSGQRLPAVVGG
jgi:polyphenol oxidase